MAIDASAVTEYTDAELLKLYRWGLATGAAGSTRSIGNRTVTFPDIDKIKDTIEWLEGRIESAGGSTGGNIALVKFGAP